MPYSYLTCTFPKGVASDPHWKRFDRFLTQLVEKSSSVEDGNIGDTHFVAASTRSNSFAPFVRLALQVYSYCHITAGKSKHFRPKLCLFQGKGRFDGAVFDALEDAAYDMMAKMPDGWIACHSDYKNELFAAEPALSEVDSLRQDRISNTYGETVALNCWSLVAQPKTSEEVLLRSAIANHVARSQGPRITGLIRKLHLHPYLLRRVSPREMEEIIGELLLDQGFKVELTAETRDGGRDAILYGIDDDRSPLPQQKFLIEVKHPGAGKPVGISTVRTLVGVGHTEPSTGVVLVSTTRFTPDARRFAESDTLRYRLALKDYVELSGWIEEYCTKRDRTISVRT